MQSIDCHIRRHAGQTPGKTAIRFYDRSVTYAQLQGRVLSAAARLLEQGLAPGSVVAVICERNIELMVAILALLKIGCVYLPVDKLNPRPRIEYILSNSGARLVITDEELDVSPDFQQLRVETLAGTAQEGPQDLDERSAEGFCIMYTSGTTGKPKGTVLPTAGVLNHLQAKIDCTGMHAGSVVAQNAGYYFVNAIWQMFAPLVVGAELIIYDRNAMNGLDGLVDAVGRDRVSIFQAVPTFWNRFLDSVARNPHSFADLQCIISTSEKLTHPLVEKCFRTLPGVRLVNAYGQTECSDDVLHYAMESVPAEIEIPIGTPVPQTRIYIIGDDGRVCPQGEKGEICVAGIGLADGYLCAPEQTERAFVKGAALGLSERSVYRTGDIGYERADGNIVYSGRKDYQVKINGFRVELYEIEKVLLQYPQLAQTAVVCREEGESRQLIAFYIAGEEIGHDALNVFLRARLPGYMVPRQFVRVEKFPLTAMEKIDRKKLTELALACR